MNSTKVFFFYSHFLVAVPEFGGSVFLSSIQNFLFITSIAGVYIIKKANISFKSSFKLISLPLTRSIATIKRRSDNLKECIHGFIKQGSYLFDATW